MIKLLTTMDTGKILDLNPDQVRYLTRSGKLKPAAIVGNNQRLFDEREVERFKALRSQADQRT